MMECYFTFFLGEKAVTMNVHLLSHLADCVLNWGPLWAYSCFAFEGKNHTLNKLFHGTKNMSKQVSAWLLSIEISLHIL